jgi:hypothetical protein
MQEPHTHPIPPTLSDASTLAWQLITELQDVIKVEEQLAVAEKYLDLARWEGTDG